MIYKDGWLAYDAGHRLALRARRRRPPRTRSCASTNGAPPVQQVVNTTSKLVALHTGDGLALRRGRPDAGVQRQRRGPEGPARDRVPPARRRRRLRPRRRPAPARRRPGSSRRRRRRSISGATATIADDAAHADGPAHLARRARPASVDQHDLATGLSRRASASTRPSPGGDNRYLHVLSIDGAVTVGERRRRVAVSRSTWRRQDGDGRLQPDATSARRSTIGGTVDDARRRRRRSSPSDTRRPAC